MRFRWFGAYGPLAATLTMLLVVTPGSAFRAHADAAVPSTETTWQTLKADVVGAREVLDGTGILMLEAPIKAEDAALTPIAVRLAEATASSVKSVTLVVDENPSPVVATFKFGPAAGNGERMLSTRVRVDAYTNVRALAEMDDGRIYMVVRFVKGAGGCSAPAAKDADAAAANIGKIQIKETTLSSRAGQMGEAVLMIRHPNSSGFQMNPETGTYIPARYIDFIEVMRDDDVVFTMEGGISLSEDPNFRFTFAGRSGARLVANVRDSAQTAFYGRSR